MQYKIAPKVTSMMYWRMLYLAKRALMSARCILVRLGCTQWGAAMPVLVGVLALAFITYMFRETSPNFVDLHDLHEGAMTEAQRQTVTMITELNKFLVSMVTLMFGAIAFFIMHYRRQLDVLPLNLGLLVALVLLGLTYFFGFMTYSQLATELSQNALGTIPKKSRIFYYLEMEFWTFLGASLTILFIFLRALLAANRDRRAEGG